MFLYLKIYAGSKINELNMANVLSCNTEKLIWISWNNRKIQIGQGKYDAVFRTDSN